MKSYQPPNFQWLAVTCLHCRSRVCLCVSCDLTVIPNSSYYLAMLCNGHRNILREAGTEFVCIIQMSSGLSPRRLGCDFRAVHMKFVANKVALRQFFLRVLLLSPVSIILTVLYAHMHLHVAVTRRTDGRSLGTFQNTVLFRKMGSIL